VVMATTTSAGGDGHALPPADRDAIGTLAEALRRVDECLDRAEGAAERLRGEDGRTVREALDDASEIVARALKAVPHA